jgi:SAM-dependent MidA family methyltransferase
VSDSTEKLQFLLALQKSLGGSIPFDQWMREALYHRDFGYYTAKIREFGRRGDFTTWPGLNEDLGRAIGQWALENRAARRWHLIELGAGSGELAAAVMKAVGWWNQPRYHIVEISTRLKQAQQKRLGSSATWHTSVFEALASSAGTALIFSNELVDAFPCRVFKRINADWYELALRLDGAHVKEEWQTCQLPDSTGLRHPWAEGQRVEVHESYKLWLRDWLPAWESGAMLTIDYGDTCPALYHRRPAGTLRAYAHHQRLEGKDVYAGFGLRDLTADVNFSDLQSEPTFSEMTFSTLAEFISTYGRSGARDRTTHLLHAPGGAGEAFKVLIQTR